MESIIKDLNVQIKVPYDGKAQSKLVSILNFLFEKLKTLDKKKLNEIQPSIEEILYNLVINNKGNNDLCNRYIFLIYKFLFEHGLVTKISDFINKYILLLQNSKLINNIKGLVLWLLGKVCYKVQGKTSQLGELVNILIKIIKSHNEGFIRTESFRALYRILRLKQPSLHSYTNDIFKLIIKQEKNTESRKCVLKTLEACLFFFNSIILQQQYEIIIGFLLKMFEDDDYKIRQIAIEIYVNCHQEKVFDQQIEISKIIKRKILEQSKNFLEIILCFGNYISSSKQLISNNFKSCLFKIIQTLLENNIEFINSQEKNNIFIFEFLIAHFPIQFNTNHTNFLNFHQNLLNFNNKQSKLNFLTPQNNHLEIEDLYRSYMRHIFPTNYRKNLLTHIYKKLNENQNDNDKIEYISNIKKGISKLNISKNSNLDKYIEHNFNSILICFLELSENNCELFEQTFASFQDLSHGLEHYLISSVKSFRMIISRVLINFAYFIPSWRSNILTLILNLSSVAHAEVAALENSFIYFVDESQNNKNSIIIQEKIEFLKDICNCLASILTIFSHKNYGIPVDISNAALSIANNMIIGKFTDDDENINTKSINDRLNNFNNNFEIQAYKEAGWMIIQGLVSIDNTWLKNNFKTLVHLWKYAFAENSCEIKENELQKADYREALLVEFFIKKSALTALRKFILSGFDQMKDQSFQLLIAKLLFNAISFFIPNEQKKTIIFLNQILKEKYKEAKTILFECFVSIPLHLYTNKFVSILHLVCDEILNDVSDYSYEIILSNLNWFDTFLCEKNFIYTKNLSEKQKYNEPSNYIIDNFGLEKFDINLTNQIAFNTNSKIVDSSVNLLVEILLYKELNVKNRQQILMLFLSHLSNLNSNPKDIGLINKALKIVYSLYLLLKKSYLRKNFVMNDDLFFTNSKIIFDLGMSFDSSLIRRISSEGHGLLIYISCNPAQNIDFYIKEFDCKIMNAQIIDPTQTNSILFLIANIFRFNDFTHIKHVLDILMNIIFYFFNKPEDFADQWFSQSIFIICEILIKNNEIEKCRKLIEVYKINFLFINKDNHFYFKELVERNSLLELKLLLIYSVLQEIDDNEIEVVKIILNKYFLDEKYKYPGHTVILLYFAKNTLLNPRLRDHIHNDQFLKILLSILKLKNNNRNTQINYLNDLEIKIILEIFIYYMLNQDKKIYNKNEICELILNIINISYIENKYFYFNNIIFKQIYNSIKTNDLIFDKNNDENIIKMSNLMDLNSKFNDNHNKIIFNIIYSKTILIKLSKVFLKIFFEMSYSNYPLIINFIKDLIQNQNSFYITFKSSIRPLVANNSDSLKSNEVNENALGLKSILSIRNLNIILHPNVLKFFCKSLKSCLNLNFNKYLKADNQLGHQNLFDFLNAYLDLSLLLISSEESWDIKFVGVKLLKETIKKFSNVKDFRMEDNSLLLQQYEAQINSCIKTLFTYTNSIKSTFSSIKLFYYVLSIPITNDNTLIKKTTNFIDIKILLSKNVQTSFSEKFDHLLICKKFNFFCNLYLSFLKYKKMISISVIKNIIYPVDIYCENLTKVHYENFGEFFKSIYETFFNNIYLMLLDIYVVFVFDEKISKNYKNFNFISSGNRISYSSNKLLKYSQTYLKVLGFLSNDKNFQSKFEENSELKNKITNLDISPIFHLIFYLINHFSIKKLQPVNLENESQVSEYIVNSENDISDELKEKIILNSLIICEMIDNMTCFLGSELFSYSKILLFDILKISINLFTLSIDEIDCKLLNLFQFLIIKSDKLLLEISQKNQFFTSLGKFCLFYYNIKIFSNSEVETVIYSKLIELLYQLISKFTIIKDSFEKDSFNEYISNFINIILKIFKNTTVPSLFKLSTSKFFNSLFLAKDTEMIILILSETNEFLNFFISNNCFDKFFTLFYTLLQFLSKKLLENKSNSEENKEILENVREVDLILKFIIKLSIEILTTNNNTPLLTKSMLMAFNSNNDQIFNKYFEHILYYIINKQSINLIIIDNDFQKLVLSFILKLDDPEKVKILSNILVLKLNANFESFEENNSHSDNVSMIVCQLIANDTDFFKDISKFLNRRLIEKIESLIKAQKSTKQIQDSLSKTNYIDKKYEEIKTQEPIHTDNVTSIHEINNSANTNSKLKVLKFSK